MPTWGELLEVCALSLGAADSFPAIADIEGQHVVHSIVGAEVDTLPEIRILLSQQKVWVVYVSECRPQNLISHVIIHHNYKRCTNTSRLTGRLDGLRPQYLR